MFVIVRVIVLNIFYNNIFFHFHLINKVLKFLKNQEYILIKSKVNLHLNTDVITKNIIH